METIDLIQTALLLGILFIILTRQSTPVKGTAKTSSHKIVMDTSALIDGRILEVANAGFISAELVVPRFVIGELQLLADGNDPHKRERARFGLDVVKELQGIAQAKVTVNSDEVSSKLPTDDKLVVLAKKIGGELCTTDYNLNKVATIEGVRVLNVNELANAMRPVALPGERKRVKIVQKGSNKDQGVGYLDDGSMVVVENGVRSIGKVVEVEVSRYIQTDAGKMLFARKVKN